MIYDVENNLESFNNYLFQEFNIDFRNYAGSSYARRIERFIRLEGLSSTAHLEEYLSMNPELVSYFINEVTVNTTEMFRDPDFWNSIRNTVIPKIASHDSFRIWHAGCSSGQEPFSMVILLKEMGLLDKVKIVATDLNGEILQNASKGIISGKEMELNKMNYRKSGGKDDLDKYFLPYDRDFKLNPELIEQIKFSKHDLVQNNIFSKFDLILCRNVLIYFNKDLQNTIFDKFSESLFKAGFLAIGRKETMLYSPAMVKFKEYDSEEKIYQLKSRE